MTSAPLRGVRGLLLDLDGTLYDPDGLIPGATEAVARPPPQRVQPNQRLSRDFWRSEKRARRSWFATLRSASACVGYG